MGEISAVKRTKTAEEGARSHFQTTELIINHLKRDFDKKIVYTLSSQKNTLTHLLAASCAVHCYHYLGIKTRSDEEIVTDVKNINAFESVERNQIYSELLKLMGNSINNKISLAILELNYEKMIIKAMLNNVNINDKNFIENLSDQLEEHLIKSLNQYPSVFWFDHVGYLTGYTPIVKSFIIRETSKLKSTAIDLENDLVKEEQGDKYIELSTLALLLKKMKKDFEFSSIRDLKLENFPIKKILNQIISYRLNYYPISETGLKGFLKATELKRIIYQELAKGDKNPIDFQIHESEIISIITEDFQLQAKIGPNEFVYYLQNLLEINFDEIISILSRFGIYNISLFTKILSFDISAFFEDIKIHNLSKMFFMNINSTNNILFKVQEELNKIKYKYTTKIDHTVKEILMNKDQIEINFLNKACVAANVEFDQLKEYIHKLKIIDEIIIKKYPIKESISAYSYFFDIPNMIKNLSKTIYYTFFRRISQQIARVLETYVKLIEDKGLYLLGIRRILESNENEDWVAVKIEELIIQRLMTRQEELAMIFDAKNNAFLVNSFIFARLFDTTSQEALKILQNEPSSFYDIDNKLSLPTDMISPVSYVISFDILNRLKEEREYKQIKKEQFKEIEDEKSEKRLQKIKDTQDLNTLNWIEKKITSSLISVSAISVNPMSLYWNEKDNHIVIDNIVNHSELESRKICAQCGFDSTSVNCPTHPNQIKKADVIDLFTQFYYFALNKIKDLWPKAKLPEYNEIHEQVFIWTKEILQVRLHREITINEKIEMIEGERRGIAKKIAQTVGKKLDKTIYKKFKLNLKKKS